MFVPLHRSIWWSRLRMKHCGRRARMYASVARRMTLRLASASIFASASSAETAAAAGPGRVALRSSLTSIALPCVRLDAMCCSALSIAVLAESTARTAERVWPVPTQRAGSTWVAPAPLSHPAAPLSHPAAPLRTNCAALPAAADPLRFDPLAAAPQPAPPAAPRPAASLPSAPQWPRRHRWRRSLSERAWAADRLASVARRAILGAGALLRAQVEEQPVEARRPIRVAARVNDDDMVVVGLLRVEVVRVHAEGECRSEVDERVQRLLRLALTECSVRSAKLEIVDALVGHAQRVHLARLAGLGLVSSLGFLQ
eukprot:1477935-Prymnesium_polylepis.1